jgi:hypothetical protein
MVYEWDSVNMCITGPQLFASAILSTPGDNAAHNYLFTNVNTPVVACGTYVLMLWAAQGAVPSGFAYQASSFTNTYAGGGFVYQNNMGNFAVLSTSGWVGFGMTDATILVTYTTASSATE